MNETQCTGVTAKGGPCPNKLTRLFPDVGYRCRHHVPIGAEPFSPKDPEPVPQEFKPEPPPFDHELRTLKDARKMQGWAANEVAQGRMSKDQGDSITRACAGFKALFIEEQVKGDVDKIKRTQRKISDAAKKTKTDDDDIGTD